MGRVADKVAIVTGAAGGIGSAIARCLAEHGARVLLTDISEGPVHTAANKLRNLGLNVSGMSHDVSDGRDWERVFSFAGSSFGNVDILVNNAGLAHVASIEDVSLAEWRRIMSVNLDGAFLGTQAAIAHMRGRGGSIVNIASIRALAGNPNTVAYDTSKAGVVALTRSAALHCARQAYNIRINAVLPGYVETDMVREVMSRQPDPEAAMNSVMNVQPTGRMGLPEEIANTVLFLASDESSFMVGSQLVVDGGYTAQ